jgi:hypothetical protein
VITHQPISVVRALLECGAKVGAKNFSGANALNLAEENK